MAQVTKAPTITVWDRGCKEGCVECVSLRHSLSHGLPVFFSPHLFSSPKRCLNANGTHMHFLETPEMNIHIYFLDTHVMYIHNHSLETYDWIFTFILRVWQYMKWIHILCHIHSLETHGMNTHIHSLNTHETDTHTFTLWIHMQYIHNLFSRDTCKEYTRSFSRDTCHKLHAYTYSFSRDTCKEYTRSFSRDTCHELHAYTYSFFRYTCN